MSDRPGELSTADFAGRQTRDPDDPVVRPDERMPEESERLARDDERGDHAYADETRSNDAYVNDRQVANDAPVDDAAVEPAVENWDDRSDVHDHAEVGAQPLMASGDAEGFRAHWTDVQTSFVDSPRDAVQQADALVAELMQHLASTFADERSNLERQWDRGDDIATDDLRTAFQRYRTFFERLLAT